MAFLAQPAGQLDGPRASRPAERIAEVCACVYIYRKHLSKMIHASIGNTITHERFARAFNQRPVLSPPSLFRRYTHRWGIGYVAARRCGLTLETHLEKLLSRHFELFLICCPSPSSSFASGGVFMCGESTDARGARSMRGESASASCELTCSKLSHIIQMSGAQ